MKLVGGARYIQSKYSAKQLPTEKRHKHNATIQQKRRKNQINIFFLLLLSHSRYVLFVCLFIFVLIVEYTTLYNTLSTHLMRSTEISNVNKVVVHTLLIIQASESEKKTSVIEINLRRRKGRTEFVRTHNNTHAHAFNH